eukprot:scaffold104979_cov28-Tisochrysis_lutea.AAC.5
MRAHAHVRKEIAALSCPARERGGISFVYLARIQFFFVHARVLCPSEVTRTRSLRRSGDYYAVHSAANAGAIGRVRAGAIRESTSGCISPR